MKKVMITIGRQFGSGGHKIGEYLPNRLGLSYYDNELILLAAQRGNLKVEHIEALEEMIHNPILYEKQETVVEDSLEETIFQLQQEVILQIAEEEENSISRVENLVRQIKQQQESVKTGTTLT